MNNPMDENRTAQAPKPTAKKKTWAVLLAAVVSFLVVLAVALVILFACNTTEPSAPSEESAVNVGEVSSEFFAIDPWYEKSLYTKEGAYEVEGVLLDVFEGLSLGAVLVSDIDNYNYDVDTVKMIDLVSGKTLLEMEVKNLRGVPRSSDITAEFCDVCGVFAVEIEHYDNPGTPDFDESYTEVHHYTSKATPAFLGVTDSRRHECRDLGDVYAIRIDKKISFFDEEMNLLSDMNGDFVDVSDVPYLSADSYMVSENEGYFYFFNNYEAAIFNLQGNCTAMFKDNQTTNGSMGAAVLNDGKLLIQRMRVLDPTTKEYDIRVGSNLVNIETYIMNNVTGEISEIECGFIVSGLSAAYEKDPSKAGFPLVLKEGYENQAYVHYFKDGVIAVEPEYVVLDNSLKVLHTFDRAGKNIDFTDSFILDESRFVAKVLLGPDKQYHLFDLNGRFISVIPGDEVNITDSFIVSDKVIYNHEMKALYNFAQNGFTYIGVTGDVVYLERFNEATEKNEVYTYSKTDSAPVLAANGIDLITYVEIVDDYCVVLDERGWKTVYNLNGEIIAATDGDITLSPADSVLVMTTVIDGTVRNYVLPEVKNS